jgi:hypothetical protein
MKRQLVNDIFLRLAAGRRALLVSSLLLGLATLAQPARAGVVDLEDLGLTAIDQYENGENLSGSFASRGVTFLNHYNHDATYGYWSSGWAYSSMTDTTTAGYTNQYSAITGSGADGSLTYGVGFIDFWTPAYPTIEIPEGQTVASAMLTNTTYPCLSMRDGDSFAKKFGGASGSDADWFLLTITGLNESDNPIAASPVEFYLADYRSSNNALDYIVDEWTQVDLSSLVAARKLRFNLTSSDNDPTWGMCTPAYFALDNLVTLGGGTGVPEPTSALLMAAAALGLIVWRRSRS